MTIHSLAYSLTVVILLGVHLAFGAMIISMVAAFRSRFSIKILLLSLLAATSLVRPMTELFWSLLLWGTIVCSWSDWRKRNALSKTLRVFSLNNGIIWFAVVACVAACLRNQKPDDFIWQPLLIGAMLGLSTCILQWATLPGELFHRRIFIGMLMATPFVAIASWVFQVSMREFELDPLDLNNTSTTSIRTLVGGTLFVLILIPFLVLFQNAYWRWFQTKASSTQDGVDIVGDKRSRILEWKKGIPLLLLLICSAIPMYVYVSLLTPPRFPRPTDQDRNDFQHFSDEVLRIAASPLANCAVLTPFDPIAFENALAKEPKSQEQIQELLQCPFPASVRLEKDWDMIVLKIRPVASIAQGRLKISPLVQEKIDELDSILRLSEKCRHGVLIDELVAASIEAMALGEIESLLVDCDLSECKELYERLAVHESGLESFEVIQARDRIFMKSSNGWLQHFYIILFDRFVEGLGFDEDSWKLFEARRNIAIALIAIRLHEIETGKKLQSLDQLSPSSIDVKYLTDPFDSQQNRLKSSWDGKRLLIYSIGSNRTDEKGLQDVHRGDVLIQE